MWGKQADIATTAELLLAPVLHDKVHWRLIDAEVCIDAGHNHLLPLLTAGPFELLLCAKDKGNHAWILRIWVLPRNHKCNGVIGRWLTGVKAGEAFLRPPRAVV